MADSVKLQPLFDNIYPVKRQVIPYEQRFVDNNFNGIVGCFVGCFYTP